MSLDVYVAAPDNTMQSAAQIMADLDVGFLPVAERGRLIGIVTDRDIAIRGVAIGKAADTSIRDIMSPEVKYCFQDDDIEDVLENMGNLQLRRLPVLDGNKKLAGIISLGDLASHGTHAKAGKALSDIIRPSGLHSQRL